TFLTQKFLALKKLIPPNPVAFVWSRLRFSIPTPTICGPDHHAPGVLLAPTFQLGMESPGVIVSTLPAMLVIFTYWVSCLSVLPDAKPASEQAAEAASQI